MFVVRFKSKKKKLFCGLACKLQSRESKQETGNLHGFDPFFHAVAKDHPVLFEGNLLEQQIL